MPEPIDLTTPDFWVSAIRPGPNGTVDVVAAVAAAMAELPAIGKDSKAAKEQGGYPYRGIEAITGHLQALLAKHQVLTIPRAEILATVPSPGWAEGWTDVTVRVEWLIAGADGSSFTAVTNGIGRDKADKGSNKAQSQAYKYLLLPLFCIADRKDDADGDTYEDGRANTSTEVTLAHVTAVAGRVFKTAGDEAPEGQKTQVRDRLRHAVIWVATKGRTASLKDCTPEDLAAVHGRLKMIEAGTVTFTHDHAGVVFSAPQGARAVLWNEFEVDTNTPKEGAGSDGPASGGDAGPDGETTPATGPLDAATSDGPHSHDVGRTGSEPAPTRQGEGEGVAQHASSPEPAQGALTEFEHQAEAIADSAERHAS